MNIVFLLRPWPVYGGGETVTITLANEMVKRQHTVHVLYTKTVTGKKVPYINEKVVSKLVSGLTADEHHKFSHSDISLANSFLKDYIVQNDIHVVINQWWPAESLSGIKELCIVIKCLHMSLFRPSEFENIHWRGWGILIRLLGKNIYNWHANAKACRSVEHFFPFIHKYVFLADTFRKEYLEHRGDAHSDMLEFCNNPLPFDDFLPIKDLAKKENIVLFVGRMYDGHKKVSKILECWKKVEAKPGISNWKLVLVGDGPDKKSFEQQAKRLGLRNYEFTGHRYPKPYYRKAKIFVMASTHEGWPMTLVESLQNGVVPVVRNTFSSLHDIITHQANGLIITADDTEGYVKTLYGLMKDEERIRNMACHGISSCRRFSVENIVDRWELIFKEIQEKKVR